MRLKQLRFQKSDVAGKYSNTKSVTSDQLTPNRYSPLWFDVFHVGIDQLRTNREVEFICRSAPRPHFQSLLDVCCGMGRHARALCDRGYAVTGVDRDPEIIAKARELGGGPDYAVADIREHEFSPGAFETVIVMGQSFGHFDQQTNRSVFSRLARNIGKGGRVILDVWNPDFFVAHQGERELHTARGSVRELKRVEGNRLFVQLHYPNGDGEKFEWELFTAAQMQRMAESIGLEVRFACAGFDSTTRPAPTDPRLQFVLEAN